ncbi:LytTR family DNA-binding domain-containing protein [Myxococcus sp. AB036A]|uniref:LytTR family DNA-binding domain-containing protein n=1 Tax=Myxococcus sp. AB036A TaxID=2562793 RepID=UPI001E5AD0C1|nr:LytTR family DNA-binding domain-containing protein [Myxococcus sp. AB036A]
MRLGGSIPSSPGLQRGCISPRPFVAIRPIDAPALADLSGGEADSARFFRASHQHLINLDFIESLEPGPSGTRVARLRGGREVEMTCRQSQRFRERLSA